MKVTTSLLYSLLQGVRPAFTFYADQITAPTNYITYENVRPCQERQQETEVAFKSYAEPKRQLAVRNFSRI